MTWSQWLVFAGISLFMAFTPGPAVLLAVSNAVSVGPARAMLSSIGNALGLFLVSAVAMAGLGVVLSTSAQAFLALKIAGAGYLIYLGVKQWRNGGKGLAAAGQGGASPVAPGGWRLFLNGVTVAVTNPKAILFFTALFPQFLVAGVPAAEQFVVLTATFAGATVLSHIFYVLLARGLRRSFADPRRVRWFNRVSGGAFIVLGLGLLRLRHKAA